MFSIQNQKDEEPPFRFRSPTLADAVSVSDLIRRCPPLDVNSHYVSLLLCSHFRDTCVLAECGTDVAGFLSAYRPPSQSDTIFVWQVAVDDRFRGRRMASRMLDSLLSCDGCNGVRYLEATITPSNSSSQKLFLSLAERLNTKCRTSGGFSADLFLEVDHEPEELYRIGPFEIHDDQGEDQ